MYTEKTEYVQNNKKIFWYKYKNSSYPNIL